MNNIALHNGDCLDVMKTLPENSVDTVITDPPYGLSFMGKDWDHGVPGAAFWIEALRVAKPGAMLLAFGGTRTHHRLMVAIEDAGWQIRDCLMWIYGTGFPKSHNISKAIDKAVGAEREIVGKSRHFANRGDKVGTNSYGDYHNDKRDLTAPATPAAELWDGWGTALKPAWEPIILAMAPLDGAFANNALEHGVAGLNIDEGRIETKDNLNGGAYIGDGERDTLFGLGNTGKDYEQPSGRFPANLLLDEDAAAILDRQSENKSRFFYIAKASKAERNAGLDKNNHPTVKPIDLMRYLCRLTATPTGGIVLDPFMGSGTTGMAAAQTGRGFVGIELEPEYFEIAKKRIALATGNLPANMTEKVGETTQAQTQARLL